MAKPAPSDDTIFHPIAADLALPLLEILAAGAEPGDLMRAILPRALDALGAEAASVLTQEGGRWERLAGEGLDPTVSEEAAGRACDAGRIVRHGGLVAAPLAGWHTGPAAIVATAGSERLGRFEPALAAAAEVTAQAAAVADRSTQAQLRCRRLAGILQIAARWQRQPDSAALLHSIASAASELLGAERASIFLLDPRRGVLVARPALGVEGEELEVDAHSGVVGVVLDTNQPRRWTAADPADEVNREVDRRIGFRTRNLVAVPLHDERGRPVGVFEVLNKQEGSFTQVDQQTLVELATHAAAAIENAKQRERLLESRRQLTDQAAAGCDIIGSHPAIVTLRESIQRVSRTDLAVMLLGENGTGKEVAAKALHFQSDRRHEPFVAVNCAALVESLLESELFGHEKGAFTDAHTERPGKFELAHRGTLFLDEVGDLSPGGQAKLLRVLEEKVIVRVGGVRRIEADARVIAATNRSLAELVQTGKFREDLYYRLNVVSLHLPPLRDRGDDILTLAEWFLEQFSRRAGRRPPKISSKARQRLREHSWPGNVRELRNLAERIAFLCPGDTVEEADLAFSDSPRPAAANDLAFLPLAEATRQFQARHIQQTIERSKGRMTEAATRLGLHRSNLYRKMRQLGLDGGGEDET